MALRTMMYCGGRSRKVRVIQPDGHPRHFYSPITVRELLLQYPHRYCVHDASGSILSMDFELEDGNTYMLVPLPHKQRDLNSQPWHSKAAWRPSLDMIAENKTFLEREKEWVTKKEEIKAIKPVQRKAIQYTWEKESLMSMAYLVPSGFIF